MLVKGIKYKLICGGKLLVAAEESIKEFQGTSGGV